MEQQEFRRRPLLALTILVAAALIVFYGLLIPRSLLVWVLCCTITLGLVWWMRYGILPLRGICSVVIAAATYAQCSWIPSQALHPPELRARLEGTVLESGRNSWFVVDGTIDAVGIPAMACTVIVQHSESQPISPGTRIVATGMMHRGTDEQHGWLQSRAASVMLRIDRSTQSGVWILRSPPAWQTWRQHPRQWLYQRMIQYHDTVTVALLMGMVLGDRSHLDEKDRSAVTTTGTSHLLTVSGLHVGVITAVVVAILGVQGGFRRWWQWAVVTLLIGGYVVLTGGAPPAVRAAVMAALAGIGLVRQCTVDGLNLLGASCLLQWLIWPWQAVTPSFIISSTVTASVLWGAPHWRRILRHLPSAVRGALAVSVSASAGSALPVAMLMQQVAPLGPLVNVLVVPLFSAALLIALILLALGFAIPTVSWLGGWSVEFLLSMAMWTIRTGAAISAAISPDGGAPWMVGPAMLVACWWSARRVPGEPRRAPWVRTACAVGLLATSVLATSVLATQPDAHASAEVLVRPWSQGSGVVRVQCTARRHDRLERQSFLLGRRYGRLFVRLSSSRSP